MEVPHNYNTFVFQKVSAQKWEKTQNGNMYLQNLYLIRNMYLKLKSNL